MSPRSRAATVQAPPIAALYVRVSSRRPGRRRHQLETQEARCRAYAVAHGYTVDEAHVYREVYTGVELWERPQLTRMRDAVRRQRCEWSSPTRSTAWPAIPSTSASSSRGRARRRRRSSSSTEPLDDSPEGQLIRFVRGYAAKVEHEKIRERTMRGRIARVQSGKPAVGRRLGTATAGETRPRRAGGGPPHRADRAARLLRLPARRIPAGDGRTARRRGRTDATGKRPLARGHYPRDAHRPHVPGNAGLPVPAPEGLRPREARTVGRWRSRFRCPRASCPRSWTSRRSPPSRIASAQPRAGHPQQPRAPNDPPAGWLCAVRLLRRRMIVRRQSKRILGL